MEKKVKFAFVSNIIEHKDVRMKGVYPILGYFLPIFIWRWIFVLLVRHGKGFKIAAEYDVFGRATGYTVLILMTAEQMVSKKWLKLGKEITVRACLYAQNELGVDVIGLGSLTKSITNEGSFLKENGIDVAVTHGDSYTTASGMNGIKKMKKEFQLAEPTIAVIGAYGKIGRAMCMLLAKEGYRVIAMGRDLKPLRKIQEEGNNSFDITTDLKEALDKSDIAVMVTSAPYSIIDESVLEKNRAYFIYDMGQPSNLGPARYNELVKSGFEIIRIDGGFEGNSRDFDIRSWMRLEEGVMYACYVETVTQALSGDFESHVGPVNIEHVAIAKKRAQRLGFSHRPLSCFGRPLEKMTIMENAAIPVAVQERKLRCYL